jgi:hypothetical protein
MRREEAKGFSETEYIRDANAPYAPSEAPLVEFRDSLCCRGFWCKHRPGRSPKRRDQTEG